MYPVLVDSGGKCMAGTPFIFPGPGPHDPHCHFIFPGWFFSCFKGDLLGKCSASFYIGVLM